MSILKEISEMSSYQPLEGDVLSVYELAVNDIERSKLVEEWEKEGKSKVYFRFVYKVLKDRLLNGIFNYEFKNFELSKKARINCWKRIAQVKTLLIGEKKRAAIEIAAETLRMAEKLGVTEIAQMVASDLSYHFGVIDVDIRRYRRYRKKERIYQEQLRNEMSIQSLFVELGFLITKKRNYSHLFPQIKKLKEVKNRSQKFNLYYFSLFSLLYRAERNVKGIITICSEATNHFKSKDTTFSIQSYWNFYQQLIPFLIADKRFSLAESKINECIAIPLKGSINWHLSLFSKANLGFHSHKPSIIYDSWKKGKDNINDHKFVIEYWSIVASYLFIYKKYYGYNFEIEFKIGRFLNSVPSSEQEKQSANVAVIIVQLVHYLFDKDLERYTEKAMTLPEYWQTHLKGSDNIRARCFLKMLEKIYKANFYRVRTEAKVKKDWNLLRRTPPVVPLDVINAEVIPYETLWQIVLDHLK